MDREQLFQDAVQWAGSRYQLATALKIPRQSVYQWREGIPVRHVKKLLRLMQTPWEAKGSQPALRKPAQMRHKSISEAFP